MILGSSPLTRGKQAASCGCCVAARLIPTHAGKTLPNHDQTGVSKPHPRSRGENSVYGIAITAMSGSSPLTRGKQVHRLCRRLIIGLIPAHAGKTGLIMWMRRASWAHPHSRRENIVVSTPTIIRQGSSPLTRGKPRRGHRLAPQSRLIPAHAGKTVPARRPWPPARAHPHSRGENDWRVPSARHSCGSSPLTRGKPPMVSESKFMMGLIPAHAGKTDASPMRWNRHEAHPRSRGENRRPAAP